MSVGKELFRELYRETCRGMGRVTSGSSTRFELTLSSLGSDQWEKVKHLTGAGGDDLNEFYQGAHGNYYKEQQPIDYTLPLSDILPGEAFTIIYQQQGASASEHLNVAVATLRSVASLGANASEHLNSQQAIDELTLLKLSTDKYLCVKPSQTDTRVKPCQAKAIISFPSTFDIKRQAEADIPGKGIIKITNARFHIPSIWHRTMDAALLKSYRQAKVSSDITPVVEWIEERVAYNLTREDTDELLLLAANHGISTFSLRLIIDSLS